jgi:hypothetical protein
MRNILVGADPSNIQKICEPPSEIDESVWQYEHIRQFIIELNLLVVQLLNQCTSKSCPKMTANETWLYMCAAHKQTKECSAIDYMIHSIDHSTAIL